MIFYKNSIPCSHCRSGMNERAIKYAVEHFHLPLCWKCQNWYKQKITKTTHEAILLYLSLKNRYVPVELEKTDGDKTIDIAVTDARVNIEIDRKHRPTNPQQAFTDLHNATYSIDKGFITLRIPNTLVKHYPDETADYITRFLNSSRQLRTA